MLFNSFEFAVFFPAVALLHFLLPFRARWVLLLLASLGFYMAWRVEYVLLLLASTLIDYYAGRAMGRCATRRERRKYLFLSLAGNFGILFTFKYAGFFTRSWNGLASGVGWSTQLPVLDLVLPVGISFYTFQALSYAIDVYRGTLRPETNPARFILFVTYFPQLVAGPIERAGRLIPQLRQPTTPEGARIADGLRRMAFGLFKKVVIADRLSRAVDAVYSDPTRQGGPALALATVFFAFQIYCDFSGYSDVAVGAARVMGIELMENFRSPYLSRSMREFWQRWHISLSTWFRDYVYQPLGGSRQGEARTVLNLAAVFLLSGLWHGANWTFVLWGAFHGGCLIASRLTAAVRGHALARTRAERFPGLLAAGRTLFTFALVNLGWVLFRAHSLSDALEVYRGLFRGWGSLFAAGGPTVLAASFAVTGPELALSALFVLLLILVERGSGELHPMSLLARQGRAVRWPCYYALLLALLVFGIFDDSPFIYFQF